MQISRTPISLFKGRAPRSGGRKDKRSDHRHHRHHDDVSSQQTEAPLPPYKHLDGQTTSHQPPIPTRRHPTRNATITAIPNIAGHGKDGLPRHTPTALPRQHDARVPAHRAHNHRRRRPHVRWQEPERVVRGGEEAGEAEFRGGEEGPAEGKQPDFFFCPPFFCCWRSAVGQMFGDRS